MKNSEIEKVLKNASDDEKIRLLYRIELVELNKKLASVFARTKFPSDSYSQKTANIYHAFFDGSASNTEKYRKMVDMMLADKKKVCDYFDATTMYAFAIFLHRLTDSYSSTMDFAYSKGKALDMVRCFFDFSDLKFQKDKVCIDMAKITKEQRGKIEQYLLEYFNITDLFHDIDVYNSIVLKQTPLRQELNYDEFMEEYMEMQRMALEEIERRYDPDYYFEEHDDDDEIDFYIEDEMER